MATWSPATSIVIPAYNEEQRIEHALRSLDEYARAATMPLEVIVVDDGSTDDTAAIARRCMPQGSGVRSHLVRYTPNRGKGHAVRRGLLAAHAPVAVFSDADLSTPLSELPKLVAPILDGGADLTFGSRALDRTLIGVRQRRYRELGGRAFNVALRVATGLPFRDTQCGFKAFRMSVCRPLIRAATIDGFGFDIELLYEAKRRGLRLREIPVRWDHRDGSKVHFVRDGVRMLADVLAVRSRRLPPGLAVPRWVPRSSPLPSRQP